MLIPHESPAPAAATVSGRSPKMLQMNSDMPWSPANHVRDRKAHRELVIMLATEIYHRERGSLPSSEEALVGTYLKSLPDDSSADLADETTPSVQ